MLKQNCTQFCELACIVHFGSLSLQLGQEARAAHSQSQQRPWLWALRPAGESARHIVNAAQERECVDVEIVALAVSQLSQEVSVAAYIDLKEDTFCLLC